MLHAWYRIGKAPIPDTIANVDIGSVDGGAKRVGRFKRHCVDAMFCFRLRRQLVLKEGVENEQKIYKKTTSTINEIM